MSSSNQARRNNEQQQLFIRQATILRKNLTEWDKMLRTPRGEDWGTMLGRLNAAQSGATTLDKSIDDVLEHFVYVPKQSTANPQDIPFFLSTRLAEASTSPPDEAIKQEDDDAFLEEGDPVQILSKYENKAAQLAAEYEGNKPQF